MFRFDLMVAATYGKLNSGSVKRCFGLTVNFLSYLSNRLSFYYLSYRLWICGDCIIIWVNSEPPKLIAAQFEGDCTFAFCSITNKWL